MMSALLLYSIKSAIVLSMLYLPYMLMLRRESFFRFNRLILLGILLLSLVLPLCNIPWMSLDHQPVVQAAQLQEFFCDWSRCFMRTMLEPGKTYFLLYERQDAQRPAGRTPKGSARV